MDLRTAERPSDLKQCREKIQAFLQGSLSARATVDLNSYYVLALNDEANISVLDPLRGFGGTKLLSLVPLKDPGEDWVLSRNGRMLFVSMPQANQVAAIETITWKVLANVEAGPKPTRLALQGDGRYLWVSNSSVGTEEGTSEVTVIDTIELRKVAQIPTGVGPHDVVLTADDRYAFITNRKDGTVSIVDVRTLKKIEDLKTGSLPAAAAFSPLSNAVYVAHEGDGTVVAIDGHTRQVVARLSTKPGLSAIGFAPGGRWGFAVNRKENVVHILDVTKNQLRSTVPVGKEPDQVSFTRSFAYIRCAGSELVYMIPLGELEKGGDISAAEFPGGQFAPVQSGKIALASAVVPAPEPNAVLVANPSDQTIYYYAEGMAAPMGSFQNYRRRPKAVLVVDRSLRETAPGTYRANLLLPASGKYDVAFLLDSPRVVHCFDTSVQVNPAVKTKERAAAIQIEPLLKETEFPSGSTIRLQFKVVDSETKQLRAGLQDVRVLTFLAPGIWQSREWAHSLGEGLYEVLITPPSAGVYYVYWECASLHVQYQQLPYLILRVTEPSAAPSAKNPPSRSGGSRH
ncbi:MAG: beta-propeller fold lactonase family protein [Acidobacteria bacterium]|nr:beta-propeller fold lactonase family protein [Acidobacteriota bacterium]